MGLIPTMRVVGGWSISIREMRLMIYVKIDLVAFLDLMLAGPPGSLQEIRRDYLRLRRVRRVR